jgi:hypothetical protein
MNRERAETYLWQLAEAELRRATAPSSQGLGRAGGLPLVAQALVAVGAVDVGTAHEIQAEFHLALAARQPSAGGPAPRRLARLTRIQPVRAATETFTASRQTPWRVVPVGRVIRIRDDEIHGELGLLTYLQTTHGGRFTMAGWTCVPLPASPPRAFTWTRGFRRRILRRPARRPARGNCWST